MKDRKVVKLPAGTNLRRMSWQTLMDTYSDELMQAESKVRDLAGGKTGKEAKENVKLAKKLALARLLLMSRMKNMHERGESDAKFLVELVRLLGKSEELLGAYEGELDVWHEFLHVLKEKMKSEKLIVYDKAPTGKEDFEKAKEEFKDPHGMV